MGLSEPIKDELARVGIPETLDALINLTIQIDRRLRERRSEQASGPYCSIWMLPRVPNFPNSASLTPVTTTTDNSEPMQLGLLCPSLTQVSDNVEESTIYASIAENLDTT